MHQSLQGATFHIEHVIPVSLGGSDELSNLALACPGCNLRKSNRIDASDPDTGSKARLFSPREHDWLEHFVWAGRKIEGVTEIGRATVDVLDLNHERRIAIREAESHFGLFPPYSA